MYYLKELAKQFIMKSKSQENDFLVCYTLGASLLANILAGKGINRAGEGVIKGVYGNKIGQDFDYKMDL